MCALVERVVVSSVLVCALVEGVSVCCMTAYKERPSALRHKAKRSFGRRHKQKDAFVLTSSFLQRRRENTYFLFTIEVNDIRHPVYPQQY